MKLRTLKIGQANITPKMLKVYIGALFIQGMGIGLAVASTGDSNSTYSPNLFILVCSIISIIMIFYSSSRKEKNEFITKLKIRINKNNSSVFAINA